MAAHLSPASILITRIAHRAGWFKITPHKCSARADFRHGISPLTPAAHPARRDLDTLSLNIFSFNGRRFAKQHRLRLLYVFSRAWTNLFCSCFDIRGPGTLYRHFFAQLLSWQRVLSTTRSARLFSTSANPIAALRSSPCMYSAHALRRTTMTTTIPLWPAALATSAIVAPANHK